MAAELKVHPGRVESCSDFGVRSKMWGVQPVRWSTCAAIDEAVKQGIAMGKTIGRVAAEINVDELRADECHDCFASGAEAEMTLDGAPVGFGLGGSVTHFDSIGCGTGKLVTTSLVTSTAETVEDQSTSGTRAIYALDGPRLRLLEKSTHDFGPCLHPEKGCPSAAELRAAGYDIRCDPIPFN